MTCRWTILKLLHIVISQTSQVTEFGIISAPGRVKNKRIRNPTKMKEKIGAPSGRQLLAKGSRSNWRLQGANCSTTTNCTTTANCTKHTFSPVYECTIKVTRKIHVVYTPDIETRSYHSAKVCWELESAAISDKIHRFNRAKQGFTFTMVPSRISKLFFAFIILALENNSRESFRMFIGKLLWKKIKSAWCTRGFPLLLSSLSNFDIFLHSLF